MVRTAWDSALETLSIGTPKSPKTSFFGGSNGSGGGAKKGGAPTPESGNLGRGINNVHDDAARDQHPEDEDAYGRGGGAGVSEKVAFSDEPTVLYALLKKNVWSEAAQRAELAAGEAETWIVEKNSDNTTRWKLLPLHQACENQPPTEIVKALLDAYSSAVNMKDSGGDLPIHLACRERAEADVILMLLLEDPDTSKIADDEGRLPIHLACRQGASIEVVQKLLVSFHRGAKTADSYGLLPLHWACAQNATSEVVETLLRANPYAVDVLDKWGRTPLSLAQASTNPEKERVMAALKRDASYWTTSLISEVETLKKEVNSRTTEERAMKSKASSLEARLVEVTAASSAAAQSFRELKDELEDENTELKKNVEELDAANKVCDERVAVLSGENVEFREKTNDLARRLAGLTNLLQTMEEQRLQILRVTGDWEDSLQQAAELVSYDDK